MMIKIIKLIFIVGFFLSFTANAVPVICPSSINCNYKTGLCNQTSEWHLYVKECNSPFLGTQLFELASISASRTDFPNDQHVKYSFHCTYYRNGYNPHNNESSSIILYGFSDTFTGANWVFSGFGKAFANCSDITDPTECAGDYAGG